MEKSKHSFTKSDHAILESYKILCDGLSDYLGEGYEIVLHSLENYDCSVIKIINGYYTGRAEGAPITDLALHMLESIRSDRTANYISYNSRNKKGEPMHSTTIAIRGEHGDIIGLLCMNFHMGTPISAILKNLVRGETGAAAPIETYPDSSGTLLDDTILEIKRAVWSDSSIAASDKNKETVKRLYEKGVFSFKDSVANCAEALGVSKNTVYMHLRKIKEG